MDPVTQEQAQNMTLPDLSRALVSNSVSANQLVSPPSPISVSEPVVPPSPNLSTARNVANQTQQFIQSESENARLLNERRQQFADLAGEGTLADLFTSEQERFGIPDNLRELQDIQLQLGDMQEASNLTKTRIEGAGGQTLAQAGREVTQEDREAAVRQMGLAARASVLQGNIETASALVSQAVNLAYQDRQLRNQNLLNQIEDLRGTVDQETQQLLDQEQRRYEADQAQIAEVKQAVNAAMTSGAASSQEIAQLTDPTLSDEQRLALAQGIVGRGASEERNLSLEAQRANIAQSRASAANSYSSIADRQARLAMDQAELDAIANAGNDPVAVQNKLDNLANLRNVTSQVIELADGASPNPTAEFLRRNVGSSSTKNTQLQGYVDTLKANMLTLATDPTIKEFFGPQMSDADVLLMTAAGSNLRPDEQTPEQLRAEARRIDDFINRAQTAVREGAKGNNYSPTTITAPDGTLIEIID